jgi:hypothetical protein
MGVIFTMTTVVNVTVEVGKKGESRDKEERWTSILKAFKYFIGKNHKSFIIFTF